jgi:hypothetical protein
MDEDKLRHIYQIFYKSISSLKRILICESIKKSVLKLATCELNYDMDRA